MPQMDEAKSINVSIMKEAVRNRSKCSKSVDRNT